MVVALVVALVVVLQLGDDDVPVTGVVLPDEQLLVAAGDSVDDLHVFLFDATTGEVGAKSLTTGTTNEFNPVLSPDRTTMIYSRKRASGQPAAAMGINGSGDRPLFDESSLTECSESTGRPAWIPGTDDLVMRCFGSDGFIRMVGVDIHGNFKDTYDEIEPDDKSQDFGHPTVSPDGTTAVYPVGDGPEVQGGHPVRDRPGHAPAQACCSRRRGSTPRTATPRSRPTGDMLVWRATTALPEGADPATDVGSEVLAARIVDDELDMDNLILSPVTSSATTTTRCSPPTGRRSSTPTPRRTTRPPRSWSPTSSASSGSPPSPTPRTAASSAATPTPSTPSPPGPAADAG